MNDPVCDLVRISPLLPSYDNYVIDLVGLHTYQLGRNTPSLLTVGVQNDGKRGSCSTSCVSCCWSKLVEPVCVEGRCRE